MKQGLFHERDLQGIKKSDFQGKQGFGQMARAEEVESACLPAPIG